MNTNIFHDELKSLLEDRFSVAKGIRANYARGEDIFDPVLPLGIAFPKTTSAMSLMDNSPSLVDQIQLKELGIKILEK